MLESLFLKLTMHLVLTPLWCFNFFLFVECRVSDHPRHEDTASSCTAAKFNWIEDGRGFRGTS